MRSSSLAKVFTLVVLVVSLTVSPTASAAPARDVDGPSFREEVVRIIRVIRDAAKKKFAGTTSNADSLSTPRP